MKVFKKESVYSKRKEKMKDFINNNKTKIILGGVALTFVVGGVLIITNRSLQKDYFNVKKGLVPIAAKDNIIFNNNLKVVPNHILNNLSGNKFTARDLGDMTFCSAQTINKKMVDAGLAIKLPSSGYALTEAGNLVGETTLKTTFAGHTFSNIEWDEKVIDMIFSEVELKNIEIKKSNIENILKKSIA